MSGTHFAALKATFYTVILSLFVISAYYVGETIGQRNMCRDQFKGEVYQGKCVAVTRGELK